MQPCPECGSSCLATVSEFPGPPPPGHTAVQGSAGIWIPAIPEDFEVVSEINPGPQSSQIVNTERDWLLPINNSVEREEEKRFLEGRPEDAELAYRNPYICMARQPYRSELEA